MKAKLAGKLAAGFLGSMLIGQVAHAQMQMGGGSFTPSGRTNGNTGAPNGTSQNGGSTPLGGTSGPGGMTMQGLDFTQGSTAAGGTTGNTGNTGSTGSRNARGGRNARNNMSSSMGLMGGLQGASMNGGARGGGTTSMQTNRQTERKAQYSIRVDITPAAQLSPTAAVGSNASSGSTLRLRTAVERSVVSIVPSGASVTMDGSVAIISGAVNSDHDRKLAERMALLVPGVDSVRNELVIQAGSATRFQQ